MKGLSSLTSLSSLRLLCAALLFMASSAWAHNGMVHVPSSNDFDTTISKLTQALETKGMNIFATIPHSIGAAKVGVSLNPTTLVIFGNPKVGAPLMACAQMVAIDLPQKALVTADSEGNVTLTYNDPAYLKERHEIEGCDKVLDKVSKALANFAKAATQ